MKDFQEEMIKWIKYPDRGYILGLEELLKAGGQLDLREMDERPLVIQKYLAYCLSPIGFDDIALWYSMVRYDMRREDIITFMHYASQTSINEALQSGTLPGTFLEELATGILDIWDKDTSLQRRSLLLPPFPVFKESFPEVASAIIDTMKLEESRLAQAWREWHLHLPNTTVTPFMGGLIETPDVPVSRAFILAVGAGGARGAELSMRSMLPVFPVDSSCFNVEDVLAHWREKPFADRYFPDESLWILQDTREFVHSGHWNPSYNETSRETAYLLTEPIMMAGPGETSPVHLTPYDSSNMLYMGRSFGFLYSGVMDSLDNFEDFLLRRV